MKRRVSGYLTICLALTLGVLVTLCLTMIEGIRLNTLQMEALCMADIGMDSAMAEYHRELFRRFNLLAIDSSYGTNAAGRDRVRGRLEYYLAQNASSHAREKLGGVSDLFFRDLLGLSFQETQVEGVMFLTDGEGEAFRRAAIKALQDDLGIVALREVLGWMETVKEYHLDARDVEAEKREVDEAIASYRGKEIDNGDEGKEVLEFEDPTVVIENRKKQGILSLTLGGQELSGKRLDQSNLLLQRERDGKMLKGNLPLPEKDGIQRMTEKIEFSEYLMRYMGCFTDRAENSSLDYELEYVLIGKDADADNLKGVLNKLLAMREAANVAYLFSDREKQGEAELAALAISVVLLSPELKDLFQTALLLGWAYAESVYDLKILLEGGRIPLIKTAKNWHYDLAGILLDIWDEIWDVEQARKEQEGLNYEDYLRILLLGMQEKEMTMRAMNLVEADIRQSEGNRFFRLDGCVVALQGRFAVTSSYGYQLEWNEKKEY